MNPLLLQITKYEDFFRVVTEQRLQNGSFFLHESDALDEKALTEYLAGRIPPHITPESVIETLKTKESVQFELGRSLEFHTDFDGEMVKAPATIEEMIRWSAEYQELYFPQNRIEGIVDISESLKAAACCTPVPNAPGGIVISSELTGFQGLTRIAILHELIHLNLFAENGDSDELHNERFTREVKRLLAAGAYDSLL